MITVLTGDNSYMVAQEIKRLEAGFAGSAERLEGDDVTREQLPDLLMGATLFAEQRLIIIRQLSSNKTIFAEIEDYLADVAEQTHLVLVEPQLDKRTRVYKWLQKNAHVVEHKALTERELLNWLGVYGRDQGIELADDIKKLLVSRVGNDQWNLSQAVQKLVLSDQSIDVETVKNLIEATPQASAFELLDAIINQRRTRIRQLLSEVQQTEDAYRFLGLFSSQLYTLAAVRAASGLSARQIGTDIGAHPFVVEKLQPAARRISADELTNMIEALKQADLKIKSTGAKPWQIIELAIGRMMQ